MVSKGMASAVPAARINAVARSGLQGTRLGLVVEKGSKNEVSSKNVICVEITQARHSGTKRKHLARGAGETS